MTIKLHLSKNSIHGIRRVIEAEYQYLPMFGIQPTENLNEADIIQNHGTMTTWKKGIPSICTSHGLYWSRQPWGDEIQSTNRDVVENMVRAVAHTAPSEWVGRAMRRGGFFYPEVIYHGINADEFKPNPNHGKFVLWNKARADWVSDPKDVMRLAERMPNVQFHTTLGRKTDNVTVIGVSDYARMKDIVAGSGVYLCTARETFGIGTLEALASGVPVAGWDWGGQSEIIRQGETGYLAPPGDFLTLAECIQKCFEERNRLSANALEDVRKRWRWEPRIEQYANIIKRIYQEYYVENRPKVSVIVTAYKLDQYLPACMESIMRQSLSDFECLVIDDAQLESTRLIVEDFSRRDPRIRYCITPENLGLPGARNYGFSKARGRYIRHLDADDYLAENALGLEAEALDNDPAIHIVYGHLETVREDGSRVLRNGEPVRSGWPGEAYSWIEQMAHLNQLPSCSMMRREVLERSGGYRERMKRNEDAEFWCRTTSLGFRAKKFTQAVTYFHRERHDSKGALEWKHEGKEPDWTAWFPWRMGAGDYERAMEVLRKYGGAHPAPHLVPFGAQGKIDGNPKTERFWPINDYAYPVVSVIVTVGPGHRKYLLDALDSVQAQSYPDWECLVVNDSGEKWERDIMGASWATVINMDGNRGASAARNEGYKYARGRYVTWLDGDDYWMPWFLDLMVAHAEQNQNGVIYSDFVMQYEGRNKIYRYADFDPRMLLSGCATPGSSILIPRPILDMVFQKQGGWDEKIVGMEDWDFQMALWDACGCFVHIPEPLFVYRMYSTSKREADYAKIESIKQYMDTKWAEYRVQGAKNMCGCNNKKSVNTKPSSTMESSGVTIAAGNSNEIATSMVQIEYVGPLTETFSIRSKVDVGIMYRFGNNVHHRTRTVFMADVDFLTGQRDGNGQPLYRVVGSGAVLENRDPAAFLGQAVEA